MLFLKNFSKLLTIILEKKLNNFTIEELPNTSIFFNYLLLLQAIVIEITLTKNNSSFIIYRKEDLIY